jgi:hypothetical protein
MRVRRRHDSVTVTRDGYEAGTTLGMADESPYQRRPRRLAIAVPRNHGDGTPLA